MNRRQFLQYLGLGASATAVTTTSRAQPATARSSANPDAIGVLHDSTLCIGCRRCEEACARVNNRPAPAKAYDDPSVFDEKRRTTTASYTVVNRYMPQSSSRPVFRKQQCNHCLEPACASACFVKAFAQNPDGSVSYNPALCVGCRYCMVACPYSIPSYDYDKVLNPLVHKCTLCEPRLRQGKIPGCVEICPTGALVFGRREELLRIARQRIAATPGRYVEHIYGENEMGGSHWLYLSPVPHEELGQPVLDTISVPELTSGALSAVPIVAGLWPVFLGGAYAISKRREKMAAHDQKLAVEHALNHAEEKNQKTLEAAQAKSQKDKDQAVAKVTQELEKTAQELAELLASKASLAAELEDTQKQLTVARKEKKAGAKKTSSKSTSSKPAASKSAVPKATTPKPAPSKPAASQTRSRPSRKPKATLATPSKEES